LRHERFARLDSGFVSYERGIEAFEGTAMYVEYRAAKRTVKLPAWGFPVEAVRRRAYFTGLAWALLLDRFDPNWSQGFAEDTSRYLDKDLGERLKCLFKLPSCVLSSIERKHIGEACRRDLRQWEVAGDSLEAALRSAPGRCLAIETDPGGPLEPIGFDPMNIRRLRRCLLHTRFLELRNCAGTFSVLDNTVLTEAVGPHPLFNGIRRVEVPGLAQEPDVQIDADSVIVEMPGIMVRFREAEVEKTQHQNIIHLKRK